MFVNRVILVQCGRTDCSEWHYPEFKDADHQEPQLEQKANIPETHSE